ncbi:MAG TPA: septal ring lytic transglycosylase RlpA family protein [Caulobacteraceae bacterium]
MADIWLEDWARPMGRSWRSLAVLALAGVSLAACATPQGPAPVTHVTHAAPRSGGTAGGAVPGTMRPYQVNGVWYAPHEDPDYEAVGTASWYGAQFHNHRTADGEVFDMDAPSGAHKTLPLPSIVEVTNLENGRRLRVRINDRGPFVGGRVIDLSREAARQLGFYDKGTAKVRVRYVGPASLARPEDGVRYADAEPAPRPVEHPSADPPQTVSHAPAVRIQAAAFADRGNAERAAARLAGQGETSIDTIPRQGGVVYRVTVRCAGDDGSGPALDRIAAAGFPGARVIEGF